VLVEMIMLIKMLVDSVVVIKEAACSGVPSEPLWDGWKVTDSPVFNWRLEPKIKVQKNLSFSLSHTQNIY
jgi:hypothetical protein